MLTFDSFTLFELAKVLGILIWACTVKRSGFEEACLKLLPFLSLSSFTGQSFLFALVSCLSNYEA